MTSTNLHFTSWIKSFKLGETRKITENIRFNDILREGLQRWGYVFKWNRETNEITRICPTCLR